MSEWRKRRKLSSCEGILVWEKLGQHEHERWIGHIRHSEPSAKAGFVLSSIEKPHRRKTLVPVDHRVNVEDAQCDVGPSCLAGMKVVDGVSHRRSTFVGSQQPSTV